MSSFVGQESKFRGTHGARYNIFNTDAQGVVTGSATTDSENYNVVEHGDSEKEQQLEDDTGKEQELSSESYNAIKQDDNGKGGQLSSESCSDAKREDNTVKEQLSDESYNAVEQDDNGKKGQLSSESCSDAKQEDKTGKELEKSSNAVKQVDNAKEQHLSSEQDSSQENRATPMPPVPRQRSSSLSRCEALQRARKKSASAVSDDEGASESCRMELVRARNDRPSLMRRSSSGHRLLEARLSSEKSSSASDLRDIVEDSPAVFSCSEMSSFQEYSAITTTVRRVSRAFSGSSPPAEKSTSSETQMRVAQSRFVVESDTSPGKNTSHLSSDPPQNNLEELLASIDRDLDETRRTISCAQLLESALLIKNDSRPLATKNESTDSLRRRRRQRIIDFSAENGDSRSNESKVSSYIRSENKEKSAQNKLETGGQDKMGTTTRVCEETPRAIVADFSENAYVDVNKELERDSSRRRPAAGEDDIDTATEVCQKSHGAVVADFSENTMVDGNQELERENSRKEPDVPQDNHNGSKPQGDEVEESPRTIKDTPVKKRVFELFTDSKSEKSKELRNLDRESSESDPEHVITPRKSVLPNVHQMARQYSQRVNDKNTVDQIRMHNRSKLPNRVGSITFESSEEDSTDHTPKIKIEKITKVAFTSSPIESYKLVRRRRRRSGSRHRSDDFRRQSWSVEKVKPESEEPRKARPKSVYDMESLEATLAENLEQIEEGLEPMLIEGLEKDDVVVRGLVQHLVKKFNSQKNQST